MLLRNARSLSLWLAVLSCLVRGGTLRASSDERPQPALQAFGLNQVRLLDGPCKTALEANRRYLHDLDPERLLYTFRANAGLPTPGKPYGGWEKPDCEVRGHFVGHYLSACALMYAAIGDEELKARVNTMVADFARCQKALGGEYLSAFPAAFWDRLESMQKPPWAPYYTIHKIMAGLLDAHQLCGNRQALDILRGMAAYFKKRFDKLSTWQVDQILTVEFGGMSEVLHDLYAVTGDADHLALAHQFDQAAFLGPLALEHDNLSRIHANTHIPKICGAARRYELTGDARYRTAVQFFWDRVVNTRSYATGGSNQAEFWPDPNRLATTLTHQTVESCTTYNMLKVTRYLIRWTADPHLGDYYERAFFNGILGTQDPKTGMLAYFTPLATGRRKVFGTPDDSFWCCYGTGIESFAKLADSIYFHDDDGLYVNLFIPSTLNWQEVGVRLRQETAFPEQPSTTLIVQTDRPATGKLHIRIPWWATQGVRLALNGQPQDVQAKPTSYLTLGRTWNDGDKVELTLPMSLYPQPMPDDPEMVAILYGPLALAGLTEDKDTVFLADAANPAAWIKPVEGKPLTFRTVGQSSDLTLMPLNRVIAEPYGVYWIVTTEGSPRYKRILADREARRQRDARVVDRVLPNDPTSESAHNLQGKDTIAGPYADRAWRHATSGGWWSWDLKVLSDTPTTLRCTYWGDDVPPRTFDVLVGDKVIATQSLNRDKPGEFFDVEYKIPPDLTAGKDKITVRFRPHENNTAGGVFECATLR